MLEAGHEIGLHGFSHACMENMSPEKLEWELSKTEYLRLLNAARKDQRLWLLLQTLCATGIRVSELQYFTVEAVRAGEISVACKNKTRSILIPRGLQKLLLQ